MRVRVCARPWRSARLATAAAAALGLGGRRPPPPRPAPAQPPVSVSAAPRLRAQLRWLRELSGASRAPRARTARGRAGDAGPPRARPSPGPGPRGKGLSRPPPPPGWRASPCSPSACSCGCRCRRCPVPGRRAPQVSAPALLPSPFRGARAPASGLWEEKVVRARGGRGSWWLEPGSLPTDACSRVEERLGHRVRPLASRDSPRLAKLPALLCGRPPPGLE